MDLSEIIQEAKKMYEDNNKTIPLPNYSFGYLPKQNTELEDNYNIIILAKRIILNQLYQEVINDFNNKYKSEINKLTNLNLELVRHIRFVIERMEIDETDISFTCIFKDIDNNQLYYMSDDLFTPREEFLSFLTKKAQASSLKNKLEEVFDTKHILDIFIKLFEYAENLYIAEEYVFSKF